ncbi:hypothetical protein EUX98_g9449 [Antrodiella citrinella]|uniref:Uncharacterized protein n=1 Tax=Antrodiella citrinella TaxID=2447956 RepID=A0A4S4LV34_9APHY|nr:hypothetical protein EUX98_g9449 [Antrodiella citrinella]
MGQYWIIANIDKKFCTGSMGKLGEVLAFKGIPNLRAVLMRPERTPKTWKYVVSRWERQAYEAHAQLTKQVVKTTKRSATNGDGDGGIVLERPTPTAPVSGNASPPANISSLATELLIHIFKSIDDVLTVVCLSLTSRHFFYLGFECLVDRVREKTVANTWIGDRLILLGDYADYDDLPKDVFTAAEVGQMQEYGDDPWSGLQGLSEANTQSDGDLFDAAFWDGAQQMGLVARSRPLEEQKKLLTLVHIPNVGDNLTFDEVLAARIGWSSDPSIAMAYEGGLHRGVWAGIGLS